MMSVHHLKLHIFLVLFGLQQHSVVLAEALSLDVDKNATVQDATTSVMGLNHIGLSVRDLDVALDYYLAATGFALIRKDQVAASKVADTLYARQDVSFKVAVLKGPNMLLELTEFEGNTDVMTDKLLPQGPGMTHTCFQSPITSSGWDRFISAGAKPLSRGKQPIDLGGYGVTYGYAYDPDGNMIELEQLDPTVIRRAGLDVVLDNDSENLWMSQVAIATHDIVELMKFYQQVLGFKPFRFTHVSDNTRLDAIVDIDNVDLYGGWFKLDKASKVIEFWQYVSPITTQAIDKRYPTSLGYSFSIEVSDIDAEYQRLKTLGLDFFSEPLQFDSFWQVYARDLHGNIFALRQAIDPKSPLSVTKMDAWAF
jgi:catechol 2,3-dioxygenase-like lactoylglutathione lyase family enzyme